MALNALKLLDNTAPRANRAAFPLGPAFRPSDINSEAFEEAFMPELSQAELARSAQALKAQPWIRTLEAEHPLGFKLMRLCNVEPSGQDRRFGPKTAEQEPSRIGHHSVVTAICARVLSHILSSKGLLNLSERDNTTMKALLHDCNKPFEPVNGFEATHDQGRIFFAAASERELRRLLRLGVPEKAVSLMRESWLETGPQSLRRFLVVDKARNLRLVRGQLGSKVLHLADAMSFTDESSTAIMTAWEKMLASEARKNTPWLFEGGLGINSSGRIVHIRKASQAPAGILPLGSYASVEVAVTTLIAEEIKNALDPDSREPATQWIKSLVLGQAVQRKTGLC